MYVLLASPFSSDQARAVAMHNSLFQKTSAELLI